MQLPPVLSREDEAKFMEYHYRSPFFWDAKVFDQLPLAVVELRKNYRQKDFDFMELLNGDRQGELEAEHQERLSARCVSSFHSDPEKTCPYLTTTNAQVLFVKNDPQGRWVNGTFGRVVTLAKDIVEVEVRSNGFPHTYRIEPETWESRKYTFDPKTEKITSEVPPGLVLGEPKRTSAPAGQKSFLVEVLAFGGLPAFIIPASDPA